ncbi:MAG TPA: fused MFS/spermidine synthase, partial [Nitrospirota bacterium]
LPGRPDRLLMPYFKLGFTSLLFVEEPTGFLFVGLGMGGMPAYLRTIMPEAEVDVVEIDPGVVETARGWFGFREDERLRVTVGDGRKFIRETKKKYDVVFLDAYRDISVPSHLTTVEFMREVRGILKPGGVAVSNLWGSVVNQLYDSCVRTVAEAFPRVYKFRSFTYNYILIADTDEGLVQHGELLSRAKALMKSTQMGFDMIELVRRQFSKEVGKDLPGEVLTDEGAG